MASEWYYQIMGESIGPVSGAELRKATRKGQIGPDTLVRKGAAGNWVPAWRVKGLFDAPHGSGARSEGREKTDIDGRVADAVETPRTMQNKGAEMFAVSGPPPPNRAREEGEADHLSLPAWSPPGRLRPCPDCTHMVSKRAAQCPSCGCSLRPRAKPKKDPGISAVLSFFVPGLGQIYNGQIAMGLAMMMLTIGLYFIVVGLFVHVWLIFDAYSYAKKLNKENAIDDT